MIAVDTNILIYAYREDSIFHRSAFKKVRELAETASVWGIPIHCTREFYAIVTHPKIYKPAASPAQALDAIAAWLEMPNCAALVESDDYWPVLQGLVSSASIVGGAIHDAHIAALCLCNRVKELWSLDRDFSRFPELKVRNPL